MGFHRTNALYVPNTHGEFQDDSSKTKMTDHHYIQVVVPLGFFTLKSATGPVEDFKIKVKNLSKS